MGNQIHEYAFARYLAFLTGQEVGLNTFFYGPDYPHRIKRGYELGAFSCSVAQLSSENWLERDPIKVQGKVVEYISEDDITIPDMIERAKQQPDMSCALLGFWQGHLTYLDNPEFWSILQREFSPKDPPDPADLDASLRPIFESDTSVGVHVRRDDYLKHTDRFNTLGADYYAAALDRIGQTVKTPDVFVFSDDIEQVKSENLFECPVTYVETGSLHTDFQLFRSCRHNIIANSTFSWWSAYLNAHPDKQIIAPKYYYATDWRQAEYERNPRVLSGWDMV
ncbi:MAG: alpha-1,2-fucosyltransferase [Pseudomonadota bacterium]